MQTQTVDWQAIVPEWLNSAFLRGVLITDSDLRVRFWNDWMWEHTGIPAADVIGRTLTELYPDLSDRGLLPYYGRVLAGERIHLPQTIYGYLLPMAAPGRPDLPQMLQDAHLSPLHSGGRVIGAISSIEDCTGHDERRRDEVAKSFLSDLSVALAQSLDTVTTVRRLAQLMVPTIADWCLIDMRGEGEGEGIAAVAHTSPAMAKLAEEIVRAQGPQSALGGHPPPAHPLLLSRVISDSVDALDADSGYHALLRALTPGSLITAPLTSGGALIGTMLLGRDAVRPTYTRSDLALAEEAARRAVLALEHVRLYAAAHRSRAEAEEAVRVRDAFFSIAAHELRTPLTTLLGRAQMIQRRLAQRADADDRSQRTIQIVVAQAQRLNKMISALLDVSRIQTGRFSISSMPMSLSALVRRVVDESQLMIPEPLITIHLPEAPLMIDGDELRLEQMLQNLIGNAVKYSPGGGPVSVTVSAEGGCASIAVADQGIGIAPEAQRQLFSRFYRAENAEANGISGMGIGLFVVKEIVDLHGGEVRVRSNEGQGSTFTVQLPLRPM